VRLSLADTAMLLVKALGKRQAIAAIERDLAKAKTDARRGELERMLDVAKSAKEAK